jgi:hypothetical protein
VTTLKRHPVLVGLLLAAGIVLVAFVAMVLGLFGSIPATPVSKVKTMHSGITGMQADKTAVHRGRVTLRATNAGATVI